MNKKMIYVILCLCVLITQWSIAQTWTLKASLPVAGIVHACSFNIGDKGYIVTGTSSDIGSSKLWEYDQETDTWSSKADFPGLTRTSAVAFVIDNKAYVGTGASINENELNDFWEWDQLTDTWTQKANFGGSARRHATGFSVDGKGYIGTGAKPGMSWIFYKDFWEYDPITDSWTQKTDFPSMRYGAAGFSIENKGYICTGASNEPFVPFPNDLQEYDPASDTWTAKAEIPATMGLAGAGRSYSSHFCIGSKLYIGTGVYVDTSITWMPLYTNDFWKWDQTTNTWTELAEFEGGCRQWAIGFAIGSEGYMGTGEYSGNGFNDLWEYSTLTSIETVENNSTITIYPNPASDFITVKTDAALHGSTYSITNQLGRTVLISKLSNETSIIDISKLSAGIYIFKVGGLTYKLLKK